MKRMRLAWLLIGATIFALSGIGGALANHGLDPAIGHIELDFPVTYGSCVDVETSDVLTITNVHVPGDPSTPWTLKGQIIVQYVVGTDRITVPGGFYAVDNLGDLVLEIFYPPISDWPVQDNGTAEIHVDVQLEVINEAGVKVGEIGIGPGHDWDVFCLTPPPPPPPVDPEFEGCTPGFWKNHLTAWSGSGYSPDQLFSTVFGVTATGNPTLGTAVGAKGGGENALLRHATAALLGSANPDVNYSLTTAEVIQIVQDAYASGDLETAKNQLAAENERGCGLEGFENTTSSSNKESTDEKAEKTKKNGK